MCVVPVENIKDKCVYMQIDNQVFVSVFPNSKEGE